MCWHFSKRKIELSCWRTHPLDWTFGVIMYFKICKWRTVEKHIITARALISELRVQNDSLLNTAGTWFKVFHNTGAKSSCEITIYHISTMLVGQGVNRWLQRRLLRGLSLFPLCSHCTIPFSGEEQGLAHRRGFHMLKTAGVEGSEMVRREGAWLELTLCRLGSPTLSTSWQAAGWAEEAEDRRQA